MVKYQNKYRIIINVDTRLDIDNSNVLNTILSVVHIQLNKITFVLVIIMKFKQVEGSSTDVLLNPI